MKRTKPRAVSTTPVSSGVTCDLKVNHQDHVVGLFFGIPVTHMVWTPEQAEDLARGLLEHAKAARGHLQ